MAFRQSGETLFDEVFEFDSNLKETMAYANIQKNGNLAKREQLSMLEPGAELNTNSKSVAGKLAIEVAGGLFQSTQISFVACETPTRIAPAVLALVFTEKSPYSAIGFKGHQA